MKRKLATKINELYDRSSCYFSDRVNQVCIDEKKCKKFSFYVL